jgi:hypothetical protein
VLRPVRRHAGRIVEGRRFVRASGNRSAEAWQVESVLPVSSVCGVPKAETVSSTVSTFGTFGTVGIAERACAYRRASRGE